MDGEARRAYRHNNMVRTVWPASKTVLVEQRERLGIFPMLQGQGSGDFRVEDHYELRALPPERVAGHLAMGLWLKPRDGSRFGKRLWADKASGLLLRADILSPDEQVLETMAFSDITIGQRQRIEAPPEPGPGWRVVTPVVTRTELAAEGWTMTAMVPGFRGVGCKRRAPEAGATPGQAPVIQAVFSDGVTHVSLFIEPLHPRAQTRPAASHYGATHTLMRDRHGHWITAVGDVPPATLDRFIAALERRP
jgi:sigma-E factor negative regulatory protein RseB